MAKCKPATQGPCAQSTNISLLPKIPDLSLCLSCFLLSPALSHWNTVKPRTALIQSMPRDFITMNRGALKNGYTTAHDYNLYYKAKDIRRKNDAYGRFNRCPPKVPADMTYGITAR